MIKHRDEKFIERLEILRGERNKAQFARDCNTKQTTMLGYLSGDSQPNLDAIRRIAESNNVSCGWLLGDNVGRSSVHPQLDDMLSVDELRLINGIREFGSELLVELFIGELDTIRKITKGE